MYVKYVFHITCISITTTLHLSDNVRTQNDIKYLLFA